MKLANWIWLLAAVSFTVAIIYDSLQASKECDKKGGVLIEGRVGYSCVKLERVQ